MATLSRDTSPEVERRLFEALRKKTPGQRLAMAFDSSEFLRLLVKSGIRREYPEAGEEEMRCRLAARWLGPEWAIRVYGWDPHQHGW